MASFVRDSKFRHTTISLAGREAWYEQLNTASVMSDGDLMAACDHSFAYIDNAGGGSVLAVLPYTSVGKNHIPVAASSYRQPLLRGHTQAIQDFSFDPFSTNRIATCSLDGTVKLWTIPAGGLVEDLTTPTLNLNSVGSTPLRGLQYHPSAANLLAIRGSRSLQIADLTAGAVLLETSEHFGADLFSFTWNYGGDLLLTTGKDKKLQIVDIRNNQLTASQDIHPSVRGSRVAWLGRTDFILTVGFSATQDREFCVWDHRALGSPVQRERIDASTGLIMPFFDVDTNLLYLVGKGDTNVRLYELDDGRLHAINNVTAGDVTRGATFVAKNGLDRANNEVGRLLKLTDKCVQPVKYAVPRREKLRYHADLYPPTTAGAPAALAAEQWLAGQNALPEVHELPEPAPSKHTAASSPVSVEETKEEIAQPEETKEEGTSPRPGSVRTSNFGQQLKYRHVYGRENAKERTAFNLKPNTGASDSPLIVCNDKFWAVPWIGAGGPVYVSPIEQYGKVEPGCALINGHKAAVQAVQFNPFDQNILATAADDCHVMLWRVPDEGLTTNQGASDALCDLSGHTNAVRTVDFHPTADGIMVTSSVDQTIRVWDINRMAEVQCIREHNDVVSNISFNYDGSLFVTAAKDRLIRIVDPRAGAVTATSGEIGRNLRAEWCPVGHGAHDTILTVASVSGGTRVINLYDPRDLSRAVCTRTIDQASGQLFPFFDEDTGLCWIAGKGDTTVRFYELSADESGVMSATKANEFQTASTPIAGFCLLPKRACNVREIEVQKALKLSTDSVIPITFKMPRAENLRTYFQDDIFVPTRSAQSTITADEWLAGGNQPPARFSMKPDDMQNLSEKPAEAPKVAATKVFKEEIDKAEKEAQKREETFNKLQQMAITRAKYHPNKSMGIRGVDHAPQHDEDEDSDWDD